MQHALLIPYSIDPMMLNKLDGYTHLNITNTKELKMKLNLISIAVLAALGTSAAQADLFSFDPTGGSTINPITATLDQAPGNALAVGGNAAVTNFVTGSGSTAFTTYYQANLNSTQDGNGVNIFSNGSGGNFFTFTAGFGEIVTSAASNGSATFAFDASNPVNYFRVYATGASANNLSGAGFVSGTPILTGHLVDIPTSSFTVSSTTPVNLDQSPNGNQWGTQKTVSGGGTSDITIMIDMALAGYFPDLLTGSTITFSFFNTGLLDPFKQVDPSHCFNTVTGVCTAGGIVGSLGSVNGSLTEGGPDFQFQADGNEAFVKSVPEPATLALMGLGLVVVGYTTSRRRAA
jgi:hypothetical protein